MSTSRNRTVGSVKVELIKKSREAAMSAVQTFNNPLITFKSENFIVLMMIAWTYLLHAYYRERGIEYRYFNWRGSRRKFEKTKDGAFRYWDLSKCLSSRYCPLDSPTTKNLEFLLGLRHEIEHHRPSNLDAFISGRYQACALNYSRCLRDLFGEAYGVDQQLAYAIQFSAITRDQVVGDGSMKPEDLPENVRSYIADFDDSLSDEEFQSDRFGYRVYFFRKTVNRRGQADSVVEFVPADSDLGKELETAALLVKERERRKFRASDIVRMMQDEGYSRFRMHEFVQLWKKHDAKNPSKGFGTEVVEGVWAWYERWVDEVRDHCALNAESYR